ncbi:MAG: Gfo/Idh/MocA family oxidoreductase, partial [Rhodobiaceae bacterium]|nr:Gfo/Idh/MocA family oxidoreductase [Rhodobiaceae bacterium]
GKHILMEKPVERTLKAAEEIVDLCEAAGIHLGIVFQHRFRAASVRLKAMMDAGALGPIGTVRTDIPWWRPQSYYDEPGRGTYERDGGGVLISQAIHTLDLMLSLTGPVAEVQAVAATTRFHTMESEDFVAGGLRFANGVPGAVMATTAAYPGDPESIRIDGDKGSALLKSGTLTVRWRDGRTETHGEEASGTGGGADPMAFPHDWHRSQIAAFVDAVSAGNAPSPNGREALHVHRLIEALITSSAEKRAVTIDP